ncbi:MAG: hypothetical protein NZ523_02225 [Elioraea sp.]|nr:hypothetical protein [Elioraea sp.]MDW8444196.1 hypothetical protein [Acetobacteraceae bacterium]
MRDLVLGAAAFAAIGLAAAQASAQACASPREKAAFDLRALQTHLMVGALSCGMHDRYNAFVTRFQSDLAGAHRNLSAYFNRVHGARGQRDLNEYITALANVQSQEGIRHGNTFCARVSPMFDRVMASSGGQDLAVLAAQANLPQAYAVTPCEVRTAQTPSQPTTHRR